MTISKFARMAFSWLTVILFMLSAEVSARADEVLVSAAASLTDVLRDIGKAYQLKSKHKLALTLGPSNFLARQIDEGAPADIFFPADPAQVDVLENNGLGGVRQRGSGFRVQDRRGNFAKGEDRVRSAD